MFADVLMRVVVSSLEIGTGVAVLYFLYSLWRDVRNAFLR
jgi:hypothetical protein